MATRAKTAPASAELRSWVALNEAMREADEATCARLLREEKNGRRRKRFLLRIHSRLNRVRAVVEREQLLRR